MKQCARGPSTTNGNDEGIYIKINLQELQTDSRQDVYIPQQVSINFHTNDVSYEIYTKT